MTGQEESLWELKQTAKWSLGINERRRAIKEMARMYHEGSVHALLEIKNTAVHDEIRQACIDAIRSIASRQTPVKKSKKSRVKAKRRKIASGIRNSGTN